MFSDIHSDLSQIIVTGLCLFFIEAKLSEFYSCSTVYSVISCKREENVTGMTFLKWELESLHLIYADLIP